MTGDFNTDMANPEGTNRGEEIMATIAASALEDMSPAPKILGAGREDMVHVSPRDGGTVPDGLPSGY